jgi:flagellar biosynthetic protein FliR
MAGSYEILAPGNLDMTGGAVAFVIELTGQMFVLGVQLVAPVMIILMVSMFILGIMSRVFSQLQVFLLSFPINISLALIVLGLGMELAYIILENEFAAIQEYLMRILHMV